MTEAELLLEAVAAAEGHLHAVQRLVRPTAEYFRRRAVSGGRSTRAELAHVQRLNSALSQAVTRAERLRRLVRERERHA